MTNYLAVERALRTAAPHALVEAARAALAEHYGATDIELLMADYSLTVLQPVDAPARPEGPVPVNGSPEGRAFGSQAPYERTAPGLDDSIVLHLPVTVRGDRLGVLDVTLPRTGARPAPSTTSPRSPSSSATRSSSPSGTPTSICGPAGSTG